LAMIKAFVFGKFLPFHKGHEALICFALSKADFLTVLVCGGDKEEVSCNIRQQWIKHAFNHVKNIEVITYNYREALLPNTSQSSQQVSQVWSAVFKQLFPDYSLLVTSEPYGEFVAGYMHIKHLAFDPGRKLFPVSASAIKENLFLNWPFLSNATKPTLAVKVAVLGTESTGKTTLTNMLAEYYGCNSVLEAARDLIADSNQFTFDDLHLVATEHGNKIKEAETGSSALIIIDTDIHITKSYARFAFNKELPVNEDIYHANKAALYLYLNNDVNHVQDGTRLHKTDRDLLDISHRQVLKDHNINIVEIKGGWPERFNKAIEEIDKLCIQRMKKPF
jgi:HTH-type transcriptional repressor of NAD biosynthesis genes